MNDLDKNLGDLQRAYPDLTFRKSDNTIVCVLGDTHFGVLNSDDSINTKALSSLLRMKKFLDVEPKMIQSGYTGHYAIVLSDLTVKVTSTEHSALTFAHQFGDEFFVGRIGQETVRLAELGVGY